MIYSVGLHKEKMAKEPTPTLREILSKHQFEAAARPPDRGASRTSHSSMGV